MTSARPIVSLLVGLVMVYGGLCVVLYFWQRSMIYFPQRRHDGMGAGLLTLHREGEQILVSTRLRAGPQALIYFGGNAEDVSLNLPDFSRVFPNHALYLMHYRGYGGSSGGPSEKALVGDGFALFDRVRAEHERVVVVGRSLGSGVAVRLAAERQVERLVLVTPFDSLVGIAARHFPYIPVRWLLVDRYESGRYAPKVSAPTLLIAAERDEVIPRWSTELLRPRFAPGVASYEVVREAGHNSIGLNPEYWRLLRSAVD